MLSPEVAAFQLQANDLCAHQVRQIARRVAGGRDVKKRATGQKGAETTQNRSALCCCPVAALKPHCSALGSHLEMQTGKCNGWTFASLSSEPFSTRQIFAGGTDIILEPQK